MASDRTDGALTHNSQANLNAVTSTPSLVAGTALVVNPLLDVDMYVLLTGSGTGTYSLDLTDPGGTVHNVVTTAEVPATMTQLLCFPLRAGWAAKVTTAGGVAITKTTAITS